MNCVGFCGLTERLGELQQESHPSPQPTGQRRFSRQKSECPLPRTMASPANSRERPQILAQSHNEQGLLENLDLVEETREQAGLRLAAYQQRITRFFDKNVKMKSFQLGDMVLRRVFPNTKDPREGMLSPNWEGPYRVVRINRPGTCWLKKLDGRLVPRPWHVEHLRKYYIQQALLLSSFIVITVLSSFIVIIYLQLMKRSFLLTKRNGRTYPISGR